MFMYALNKQQDKLFLLFDWFMLFRVSNQSNLSTAGSLIQSILKEGENSKFSEQEQRLCCVVMCTSEYCMETSLQLQEKLKEKTDEKLLPQISLSAEQDLFHGWVKVITKVKVSWSVR